MYFNVVSCIMKKNKRKNITINLSFGLQSEKLKDFLKKHKIEFSDDVYQDLLEFISSACLYEEEERKIRPSLIIGNHLLDKNLSGLLQATALCIIVDKKEETHLKKRLKSLIPFCENGWRICISFDSDEIRYGILRNFNGPTGLNIDALLSDLSNVEIEALNLNYVLMDVINNFEIILKGNAESLKIDFKLCRQEENHDNFLECFCDDFIGAVDESSGLERKKLKTAIMKTVNLFSQKLHGSLCLIVDHTYKLPDDVLKDGVFLPKPIDICSVLTVELTDSNRDASGIMSAHEKYYAFTGLMLEMLNFDGVTVVDNKGRLRAYNIFVKSDINTDNSLSGGARKRAAEFLCRQSNTKYVGVYFQSQDGVSFYRKVENHE